MSSSSEQPWLRCLKFGMTDCLVDFYKVYINGGSGIQNGPGAGSLGFKLKYT